MAWSPPALKRRHGSLQRTGDYATTRFHHLRDTTSGGASPEKLEKFGGQTPMGRPGQPAELGSIYVQLAAADASYATGQVYGSAGGNGLP